MVALIAGLPGTSRAALGLSVSPPPRQFFHARNSQMQERPHPSARQTWAVRGGCDFHSCIRGRRGLQRLDGSLPKKDKTGAPVPSGPVARVTPGCRAAPNQVPRAGTSAPCVLKPLLGHIYFQAFYFLGNCCKSDYRLSFLSDRSSVVHRNMTLCSGLRAARMFPRIFHPEILKKTYLFYAYECFTCMCVCIPHYMPGACGGSKKELDLLGQELCIDGCEPPCGRWDWNWGSL